MGVWDSWSVTGGRLNISPTYIRHWRDIKEFSMRTMNRDVPLVVFHDWGLGMPFLGEIPPADQVLWLRVYAAEIFASGAIFAWPLSGGGNLYQPTASVMDTIKSLISWYSRNRELYINSAWIGDDQVDVNGQADLVQTIMDQYDSPGDHSKRMVHLINKKLDGSRNLVTRKNLSIGVPSLTKPKSVWAVSPEFQYSRKLDFVWSGETASVTVKTLEAYEVIVLDYKNDGPLDVETVENKSLQVEIWPNPAGDCIRILNNPDKSRPVQVIDVFGKVVLESPVPDDQLDISPLPSGIYILKFRNSAVRLVRQ
jgi:hypothetical protein